jgi:hypothetical protein
MKKLLNKIKFSLATLSAAIISFSSKVFALVLEYEELKYPQTDYWISRMQTKYWVVNPIVDPYDWSTPTIMIIKIAQILLIVIIPIIWIINLIKIKRIDDKTVKKKKIKNAIIIITILLVLFIILLLLPRFLKEY